MLIATFNSATGWTGKTITYDAGVFTLEGHGPISAVDVLTYDRQGHLEWAYAGLREWVTTQAEQTKPVAPLMGAAVSPAASQVGRRPRYLLVVLVTIAALFALAAVVWALNAAESWNESAGQAGSAASEASKNLSAGSATLVQVFTWPGGGPANDIRNSEPFSLSGGHQRVSVSSQEIVTEYSMSLQGWTLESADGAGEMEMINPASFGQSQSDCYLPAGSYYLSSNTVDCTWTVTVSEER